MRVEPSGIVMNDICDIQTHICTAKQIAPITAVWSSPNREQINVCRNCLEEMIRAGEWEIHGAKISRQFDVGVYDEHHNLRLVVEVKTLPQYEKNPTQWAQRIRRNLLVHSGIPTNTYFLLAAYPKPFFLWRESAQLDAQPEYNFDVQQQLDDYFKKMAPLSPPDYHHHEHVVAMWLNNIGLSNQENQPTALIESGLFDILKNATIVEQPAV